MKVASEEEVTAFDRRVLEAVAIAHRETGAPIITHAAARNRIGEAQAAVFESSASRPTGSSSGTRTTPTSSTT